jgi:hypothetical protein
VEVISELEASKTGGISKYFLNGVPELDFIYLNPKLYPDPKWRTTQVYTGQILSLPRLTEIVRGKEKKAKNYSKCDAYWLLVVVDFINPAQDQEIQVNGLKLSSDIYEKIIVYRTAYEHVLEL